jgi:regulator of protease activity HflC (stomatin/prohibitin superfamily)
MARRSEGEAQAKRRIGEAEADVVAIKGRNEGEAIRAIGTAKADAYKLGVGAMGANFGLLQIFSVLAERNIRLTPDVLVSGSGGSGEGLMALVLRDLMDRHSSKAA